MTDEKYMKEINIGDLLSGYNRAIEKRAETDRILNYLLADKIDKFLLIQGLPGTGQEQLIQQFFSCMSDEMLKQTKCLDIMPTARWNHVYYAIKTGLQDGYQYFFLKDIADQSCYQYVAPYFAEFAQNYGARIVLYGKNPTAMIFKVHDEEIDKKAKRVRTSYINYTQNNALFCANTDASQESYVEYLKRGSILQRNIAADYEEIREYIDLIANDIVSGMDSEDEYDHWSEPLPKQYTPELLKNMITNSIYKTVSDTAFDCLSYGLQQCYGNTVLMKYTKKIRKKINEILNIPQMDIADEVMGQVLDEIHEETLITPAEVVDIFEKEMNTAWSVLYGSMKCATLQCCCVDASNYCLSKKDKNMVAFQNTGFLYTLAQHVISTFRTDGTVDDVLSNHSEKADVFWQKCDELIMCRLATHNLINEICWRLNTMEHNNYSMKRIVILRHSFWEIINIIDVDRNAKRIAVIPENKLNRVASLSWDDDVCFATRRLCSSADEILICTPENAFECLGELL